MTDSQMSTGSQARMDPVRRTALVAGLFYLLTFAASIPAVFLLDPVLNDADFIVGSGTDGRVVLGCLLDLVNAVACVGTAVVLFPIVKRQNEAVALGFVTSRLFEAAVIVIGVVSLLAVVTLRQDGAAGADAATLVTEGQALVAVRDWTFLLGPGLIPGINALLLGSLMYQSGLVPRLIPVMGLDRRPAADRLCCGSDVRRPGRAGAVRGHRHGADLPLVVLPGPVHDLQGLPAVPHHRGRCRNRRISRIQTMAARPRRREHRSMFIDTVPEETLPARSRSSTSSRRAPGDSFPTSLRRSRRVRKWRRPGPSSTRPCVRASSCGVSRSPRSPPPERCGRRTAWPRTRSS